MDERSSRVFVFTTGLSETRHAARKGIQPQFQRLPAYNQNLNVAIFAKGHFYRLTPWLASRASALPDAWQQYTKGKGGGSNAKRSQTVKSSALANMVSPLQARELGASAAT